MVASHSGAFLFAAICCIIAYGRGAPGTNFASQVFFISCY